MPDFDGAAGPYGCVYTRGISQPVVRAMVMHRVRVLPQVYRLLCEDCCESEGEAHKADCSKAPPVVCETPPDPILPDPPVLVAPSSPSPQFAESGPLSQRPAFSPAATMREGPASVVRSPNGKMGNRR